MPKILDHSQRKLLINIDRKLGYISKAAYYLLVLFTIGVLLLLFLCAGISVQIIKTNLLF